MFSRRRGALVPIHDTDVSTSLSNHIVNRRNTDVSLSDRVCLFKLCHGDVQTFLISLTLTVNDSLQKHQSLEAEVDPNSIQ
jgi:hypothetical protein